MASPLGPGTMISPLPPSLPARMTTAIPRRCLPPSPTKVTTEPTCDKEGLRTYTKVTFEGKDYTDTKTEPIPLRATP